MADPIVSFIPDNDKEFQAYLDEVFEKVADLRIPFGLIANNFYKGNRKLFTLKSAGLYPDLGGLNPGTLVKFQGKYVSRRVKAKFLKQKEVGFIYPLLKRSGRLEESLSSRNAPDAEFFIGRQTLVMGTKVPYAKYHQSDREPRTKIPQRKMIFIDGGPAERAKDAIIAGRRENWTNIIRDYVNQVISGKANI